MTMLIFSAQPPDSDREADIPEEEGLDTEMADSPQKEMRRSSSSNYLKPNDVIVLEFDAKDKRRKRETLNCTSTRQSYLLIVVFTFLVPY